MIDDIVDLFGVTYQGGPHLFRILVKHDCILISPTCKAYKIISPEMEHELIHMKSCKQTTIFHLFTLQISRGLFYLLKMGHLYDKKIPMNIEDRKLDNYCETHEISKIATE